MLMTWLLAIFCCIALLFWHNEVVYSLPTPVPVAYKAVEPGAVIHLKEFTQPGNKPLFIHFFNPSCPCSRFNMPHVKSLIKTYSDKISFVMVVMNKDRRYSAVEIQKRYDLNIPVITDASIAEQCGVYSTPQAVIIDTQHKLYYRGNYNRSRYCTDIKSDYAKMAIDSLLTHINQPTFDQSATLSYGCQLPSACTK